MSLSGLEDDPARPIRWQMLPQILTHPAKCQPLGEKGTGIINIKMEPKRCVSLFPQILGHVGDDDDGTGAFDGLGPASVARPAGTGVQVDSLPFIWSKAGGGSVLPVGSWLFTNATQINSVSPPFGGPIDVGEWFEGDFGRYPSWTTDQWYPNGYPITDLWLDRYGTVYGSVTLFPSSGSGDIANFTWNGGVTAVASGGTMPLVINANGDVLSEGSVPWNSGPVGAAYYFNGTALPTSGGAVPNAMNDWANPVITGPIYSSGNIPTGQLLLDKINGTWQTKTLKYQGATVTIGQPNDYGQAFGGTSSTGGIWQNGQIVDLNAAFEKAEVLPGKYTGFTSVALNNNGVILATAAKALNDDGTQAAISPSNGFFYHSLLLVPAAFALRDGSQINSRWDPDIDTDKIPWTIVAKAAINGNFNQNQLTEIVFPTDQLASLFELAVADDSTSYIEINQTSPGQPIELTQKETPITIIGKNTGAVPNEVDNATIELRLKNDPTHRAVLTMHVMVVPDLAPLGLKFYAVDDSRFLLGSINQVFGFPTDGTEIRSSLGNTGGMYSEAQSIFSQNDLNFELIGTIDSRDVPYLKSPVGEDNGPNGTTISNLDDNDANWMASTFQRADYPDGNIACILVHQLDAGNLGHYLPESHLEFIPEDVWYPLYTLQGIQDYSWTENIVPGDLPFLPENSDGTVLSIDRVYAHESGHYMLISTRGADGAGDPMGGHDPGPYPPGTTALMQEGTPGKWIRHEDWDRAATSAVQLLEGQIPQ